MLNSIINKYYTYQPNEFIPIYIDGKLANKQAFHKYRLLWLFKNPRLALYQFTHYAN